MEFLGNQDFLDQRASLALDFLVLQVYLDYLDLKVSLDQREILDFPVARVNQGDLELMEDQDLKGSPGHLVNLELVDHLDRPQVADQVLLALLVLQAQLDHQDIPEQMEKKETQVLQA